VFPRNKKKSEIRSGIGFRYVTAVGFIIVALLFINGLFVRAFINANMISAFDLRITQAIQFAMPLILIVVEFWVFDRLTQNTRQ
jgi:hypothetical protein